MVDDKLVYKLRIKVKKKGSAIETYKKNIQSYKLNLNKNNTVFLKDEFESFAA